MKPLKTFNTLILIGFLAYWGFVYLSLGFEGYQPIYTLRDDARLNLLFPPSYRMFSTIPKSHKYELITYYKNGEALTKIRVDSLRKERLREHFPGVGMRREIKHDFLFGASNYSMINNLFEEDYIDDFYDIEHDRMNSELIKIYKKNAIAYAVLLIRELPELKKADSLMIQLIRKPFEVAIDQNKKKSKAIFVKDTLIYKLNAKIN